MQKNDAKQFAYLMAALGEAFSQEASPLKVEIYFKALSDLPIEAVEKAAWNIINSRGTATFPKVAELRDAINGKVEDVAQAALKKLNDAIRDHGSYQTVVFDDPVIHMVVGALGGWEEVCSKTDEDWKYIEKDILKMYASFSRSPVSYEAKLVGYVERSNNSTGHLKSIPEPILIGDVGKARLLLESDKGDVGEALQLEDFGIKLTN